MTGREQHRAHGAWRTTRTVALCPALAVLFAALVMCLGALAHATEAPAAAPMTTMSVTAVPADASGTHHARTFADPGGCPAGDVCCDPVAHGVRAVRTAPAEPLPAILPAVRSSLGPGTPARCPALPPARGAPDLHVLQVQRI
ncbi:hypothetical protein [Streptomyces sp. MBT62]|uniref:hypothetical protein n=1 Tax=Streptomyces sp. MBT62 TaxID=2800410 RepID=UPI001909AEE8|nr:hypothetical protein [Streptomyces sp. MBT62]MBK3563602.1 hypothetical protein [Streptomyces sp. MBT62]